MVRFFLQVLFLFTALFSHPFLTAAAEKQGEGPPPAKVVVEEVGTGVIAPLAQFSGTVYYLEVSGVACEVSGRVDAVNFDEGTRVKNGGLLVRLNSDLLVKSLESARASLAQVQIDLEKANSDLKRVENLYRENSVAQQTYDDHRFGVKALEGRVASLAAEAARLKIEVGKKSVLAPFEGVVIERRVDRGEWCGEGAIVALVASDKVVDVVVDVPEEIIINLKKGMDVDLRAAGKDLKGRVVTIIPRGDIATRTFPVKIRTENSQSLLEGMEGVVYLPAGEKVESLIVPRDAIITSPGGTVVFAVVDSKAQTVPVSVTGYKGIVAGVLAEGLKAGMKVITKGNERVREGQPVEIIKGNP